MVTPNAASFCALNRRPSAVRESWSTAWPALTYTLSSLAVMLVIVYTQYWIASFPLGKFHAIPRSSTSTPNGWGRPALRFGLPSQRRAKSSSCDAAFLPKRMGLNRVGSLGTYASRGQFAASSELVDCQMSDSLSPFSWVPLGSSKKAAVVSPAHLNPDVGSTIPETCMPDPKTYWSGVPLGQNPPPTVVEPFGSTQMWPKLSRPQSQRFPLTRPRTPAKRFTARRAPGRGPALAVLTASASPTAASVAHRNPRFDEAFNIAPSPREEAPPERPPGPGPPGRATHSANRAASLERDLKAEPNSPPGPVEAAGRVLQVEPRVERGVVLGRREYAVAVAEPRFGTLQQHAVHRAAREVAGVAALPVLAAAQQVEVDAVTDQGAGRRRLRPEQRHLLRVVPRLQVGIGDVAHLGEQAHDG